MYLIVKVMRILNDDLDVPEVNIEALRHDNITLTNLGTSFSCAVEDLSAFASQYMIMNSMSQT